MYFVILGFLVYFHCHSFARCLSDEIYRHGRGSAGMSAFRAGHVGVFFQLSYTCEARTLGVKYHIVDMTRNMVPFDDGAIP